jgi:hypothetical protein
MIAEAVKERALHLPDVFSAVWLASLHQKPLLDE